MVVGGAEPEQSNMTENRAEQWPVLQRSQVPMIRVFQSVNLSLKRHFVFPPFEMLAHGFVVPGKCATTQPPGIGTWQLPRCPRSMPKLQKDSVVGPP